MIELNREKTQRTKEVIVSQVRTGRRGIGDILENNYRQTDFSSTSRIYFGEYFWKLIVVADVDTPRNIPVSAIFLFLCSRIDVHAAKYVKFSNHD